MNKAKYVEKKEKICSLVKKSLGRKVEVWFSSEDGKKYKILKQPDLTLKAANREYAVKIFVDHLITYQSILGIGSSLEEATIYNLLKMSKSNCDRVIKSLFDPVSGMGWDLVRICFGSSDFTAREYYSYNDIPEGCTDMNLEHFTIQKDFDYNIIQVVKKALSYNPNIRVFASPWSPPAWMKSTGNMCSGSLLPKYYGVAAEYYRRAIQAYEKQGIQIYAFTLQNEPHIELNSYPVCYFTWQEQKDFLKVVKKEFKKNNIKTKIWILDHNFDMAMSYAGKILKDPKAYSAVDGIAFHDYEDDPGAMTTLHNAFPEKDIFFTERSTWGTKGMDRIIQYLRNWSRSYCAWVTCLDDKRQPNRGCHNADPTFVTVSSSDANNYRYIPEYYLLGQITKFVQAGAFRIESNYGSPSKITNIAFLNPDGSVVTVVINQTGSEQKFKIITCDLQIEATIPGKTVATYKWHVNNLI